MSLKEKQVSASNGGAEVSKSAKRWTSRIARRAMRGDAAHRSVSFQLMALVVLQLAFLVGVMAFTSINDHGRALRVATEKTADEAQRSARLISSAIASARTILVSEAALPGYANVFNDPPSCTVTSSAADVFTVSAFQIVRADGSVACTSLRPAGGLSGPGYAGAPWLENLDPASGPTVTGPVTDPVTKRRALIIAAPILEVRGALVLSLDLDGLGSGLAGELRDGEGMAVFVTEPGRNAAVTATVGNRRMSAIRDSRLSRSVASGTTARAPDGVRRVLSEATVDGVGWHVVAGISAADAYADARSELRDKLLLTALIVAMVLLAWRIVHHRIARPIRALAGAVEQAESGDPTRRLPEAGPKELAGLGKRFNRILRERAEDQFGLVEMFEKDRRAGGRRELDRMKSAFLLAISHELRTPMTAVAGYAALLEEGLESLSDAEIKEYTHNIGIASRRLDKLVSDILDMERLSRGVLEARRRPTDLRALVDLVLEITDTKDAIEVQVPKGTIANIDPGIVERIVENLVRNAVKHTPPRTPIWIRVKQSAGDLTLVVEDAGRGVANDLKKAIFEPFRQGDLPDHAPGTGVGLALVAQFARLHGGRAWVEDGFGGGASFRVSFPGATVAKETTRQAKAAKRKPSRAAN